MNTWNLNKTVVYGLNKHSEITAFTPISLKRIYWPEGANKPARVLLRFPMPRADYMLDYFKYNDLLFLKYYEEGPQDNPHKGLLIAMFDNCKPLRQWINDATIGWEDGFSSDPMMLHLEFQAEVHWVYK